MAKADGFAVMDVATDIHNDPKFRALARHNAAHVQPAFMAYIALMGECWREAERVTVTASWPALVPYDPTVVESMIAVRLIDRDGRIPRRTWQGWFGKVRERRDLNRERWRASAATQRKKRQNGARAESPRGPRGARGESPASVPSVVPPSYEEGTDRAHAPSTRAARGPETPGDVLRRLQQ